MTTTLGSAVGPFFRLDGPLPLPRSYSLLQVAQEVPLDQLDDLHWLNGAWLQTYPQDQVDIFDPCAGSGTSATKPEGLGTSIPKFAAFTANLPITCFAAQVGPDPEEWFLPHLRAAFKVAEAQAAERVLASGGDVKVLGQPNPHLTDANLDQLDTGTAVSPLDGLERLEDTIGETGRGGIIHATPATVTAWAQYGNLLAPDSAGTLRTVASRTPIVVGDGYIGAHPDGGSAPTGRQAWAFATGMIRYLSDPPGGLDPLVIPLEYRQALDTGDNIVTYRAERNYLITFASDTTDGVNPPLQAGVLIDRSISTP